MSSYAEDFEVLVTSIISISCIWIETVQNNTMMWIVARRYINIDRMVQYTKVDI
jgi:hypothetical protein